MFLMHNSMLGYSLQDQGFLNLLLCNVEYPSVRIFVIFLESFYDDLTIYKNFFVLVLLLIVILFV